MTTLENEVTELVEKNYYQNKDTAFKFKGKDGRRLVSYITHNGGYVNYYETSENSNRWSINVNIPKRLKGEYVAIEKRVLKLLPSFHEVIPGKLITEEGLRAWNRASLNDYECLNEFCYPYKLPRLTEEDKLVKIKLPILKYKK